MRYQGQGHEIEVTLPDAADAGALFADLGELFDRAYEATYTLRLDEPAEIVNWKVEAAGPAPNLGDRLQPVGVRRHGQGAEGRPARLRPGRPANDGVAGLRPLCAGPRRDRQGTALIEERESTCVIGSGQSATVDAHYNLVADLAS